MQQIDEDQVLDASQEHVSFGPGAEGVAKLRSLAETDGVTVTFHYQIEDLRHALNYHLRSQKRRVALLCVMGVGMAWCFFLLTHSLVWAIFGLLFVPFELKLIWSTRARALRRDRAFQVDQTWTISADGIYTQTDDSEGRIGWGAVQRVLDSPVGFLVFTQRNLFHLLPKRAMTPESAEQCRKLFAANTTYEVS